MVSSLHLIVAAAVLYAVGSAAYQLRQNILAARKTGLAYVVLPCSPFNIFWHVTGGLWVYLIRLLPPSLWEGWLFLLINDWGYRFQQKPFERLGDSFLAVSPGCLILLTQDAGVIHEIATRRDHFPKATQFYKLLELFGRNLLTTEGALWRLHRKATSTSFNERNAAHTFAETVHQTQRLVDVWSAAPQTTIASLEQDTMKLALHIIGYVGFGLRFLWPGESPSESLAAADPLRKYGSLDPPPGHSLTFAASVERVLRYIMLLLVLPPAWLRRLPFRAAREAYEAYDNYARYTRGLLAEKAVSGDTEATGMDIMGHLVRARTAAAKSESDTQLSDDEIMGNAFIMLAAGHDTTANTLHFALLELAAHPAAQRALQADVDRLLGRHTNPATWSYESAIHPLLVSTVGAAMNETLRMMPAVVNVPKWINPATADHQVLAIDGRPRVLPAGTIVILSIVTVHRSPRYWPGPPDGPPDLDEYVPERWFRGSSPQEEEEEEDELGLASSSSSQLSSPPDHSLFRPVRGSFVPFSDGPRSCLGRRVAQVEMVAALAVIFQRYSLELAVDDWADDAAVAAMDTAARRHVYAKAQARSREILRGASTVLTLKLHGKSAVPVRLVPRGQERFVQLVD